MAKICVTSKTQMFVKIVALFVLNLVYWLVNPLNDRCRCRNTWSEEELQPGGSWGRTPNLKELPIGHSEKIISMRIPLAKGKHLSLICAYAPTLVAEEHEKDAFYTLLNEM